MDITAIKDENGLYVVVGQDNSGFHALPAGIKLQAQRIEEANNRIMLAAEQLRSLGFNVKPVRLELPGAKKRGR